jgi:hypothetical protein
MLRAGSRTHMLIPYSEDFLIQTRPSTRTGVVKIHQGRGITVNGLQYWHECMGIVQGFVQKWAISLGGVHHACVINTITSPKCSLETKAHSKERKER